MWDSWVVTLLKTSFPVSFRAYFGLFDPHKTASSNVLNAKVILGHSLSFSDSVAKRWEKFPLAKIEARFPCKVCKLTGNPWTIEKAWEKLGVCQAKPRGLQISKSKRNNNKHNCTSAFNSRSFPRKGRRRNIGLSNYRLRAMPAWQNAKNFQLVWHVLYTQNLESCCSIFMAIIFDKFLRVILGTS